MATYVTIKKRTAYLMGESDYTTAGDDKTIRENHINHAVQDIVNAYRFSWNLKTEDLTLSSGTSNLAEDYNPKWHLIDARIVNSGSGDDDIFSEVSIADRDNHDTDDSDYVYWITYNTTSERYIFNSNKSSGTVTIYYYFFPADLSANDDVCVIPDAEAVAYLAAAKMWLGDERNDKLQKNFEQEAALRIQQMYKTDQSFGPTYTQGSPVDYNSDLKG